MATRTVNHTFRSGNNADITFPRQYVTGSLSDITCAWDRMPPSAEDLRELWHEVIPEKVLPRMNGAPRFATTREIAPGVTVYLPDTEVRP